MDHHSDRNLQMMCRNCALFGMHLLLPFPCRNMPHLFDLLSRVIMIVNLTIELTQCLRDVGLGLNKDVVPCRECWTRHWI